MDLRLPRRTVLKTVGFGGLALAGGTTAASAKSSGSDVPDLVYDFGPGQLPENLAVDKRGNKYVSVASVGQIWKFSPENEPPNEPVAEFAVNGTPLVGTTGLEVDPRGRLYVCFASDLNPLGADTNGVWTVREGERPELLTELPPDGYAGRTFPNDVLLFGDSLLVTDSLRGVVYRVWPDGAAEVWASGPLLEGTSTDSGPFPFPFPIGADGIAAANDGKTVYVSNFEKGLIVEIPVENDGSAGESEIFVGNDQDYPSNELFGSDGLAMDTRGNLYVAVNGQNEIARVSPDGRVETLASGGLLDAPADVTFGTSRGEQKTVFVVNLAFPSTGAGPSLLKLDVGIPGLPIHR